MQQVLVEFAVGLVLEDVRHAGAHALTRSRGGAGEGHQPDEGDQRGRQQADQTVTHGFDSLSFDPCLRASGG